MGASSPEVAALVTTVSVKSGLFNPGGPGITTNFTNAYTVANSPQVIEVMNDLSGTMQVTFCNGVTYANGGTPAQVAACSTAGGIAPDANVAPTFAKPALAC